MMTEDTMGIDPFTKTARAEAERFLWSLPEDHPARPMRNDGFMQMHARDMAPLMVQWARDYIAAQGPTEAEVEAATQAIESFSFLDKLVRGDWDRWSVELARAALWAARDARRGEGA